jgi:hypothetical protein
MDERLLEITDKGHPDLGAFLFCIPVLITEEKSIRPHLTQLLVEGKYVYATNGATARRAYLKEYYLDGLYRVFRKKKGNVILYRSDASSDDYPDILDLFKRPPDQKPLTQTTIDESYWHAHAEITRTLNGEEAFNAEFLKDAMGVYELYLKDRLIILDNEEFSIAVMPLARQQGLPFGDTVEEAAPDILDEGDSIQVNNGPVLTKKDGKMVAEKATR